MKLKPVERQTIVITGATSGIGLATARLAARRGARLFLIARSEGDLRELAAELAKRGAQVDYAVADVADLPQLKVAVERAVERFGGFDTWVNNAGVSVYGRLADVPVDDQRQLFETNFWGVVNGSLAALPYLKRRGGALINVGSELSDLAVPLQGAYVASKHAVKGYTNALRLELMDEGAPVSVTLIKPAGIHTQFVEHARNYLDFEPKLPAPEYAPDVVAKAILHAAQYPQRDVFVGGASRGMSAFARQTPSLFDRVVSAIGVSLQHTDDPPSRADGLESGAGGLKERSPRPRRVHDSSAYTAAAQHPYRTIGLALGVGAVWLAAAASRRGRASPP
ncbi:SDR family oxidoreductase [Paraburkholderia sp.]|jgi:short-subunit dehydrogenase|uniref:SDR family oxidoreductase n=1 Tax=Paraburkholderia sp. TaxID=1926495 RepID=UPI002F4046BC